MLTMLLAFFKSRFSPNPSHWTFEHSLSCHKPYVVSPIHQSMTTFNMSTLQLFKLLRA